MAVFNSRKRDVLHSYLCFSRSPQLTFSIFEFDEHAWSQFYYQSIATLQYRQRKISRPPLRSMSERDKPSEY
jgi:hypothetical protein